MTRDARTLPRYPVYVPSKGRADTPYTARILSDDGVPFFLVIEPGETEAYRAVSKMRGVTTLVLPHDNYTLVKARNWIRDHSESIDAARHWQIDDNITHFRRVNNGIRIPCNSGVALRVCEDFTDRYTNIGISGLNYEFFIQPTSPKPFYLNCHVYSCSLINNAMPYRWRLLYNDDTDLCLQVLTGGLCTVALNAFVARKSQTMVVAGGNTDALYQGDGRLKMARALERQWPGVVSTRRRFKRPQHVVKGQWRAFDTPLERRTDIDWDALASAPDDDYGLAVKQVKRIRSSRIQSILDGTGK